MHTARFFISNNMSSASSSHGHEQNELSRSASQTSAPTEVSVTDHKLEPRRLLETGIAGLYSQSTAAKIWKVAAEGLVDGVSFSVAIELFFPLLFL